MTLHQTSIPLRSIAAGELDRWTPKGEGVKHLEKIYCLIHGFGMDLDQHMTREMFVIARCFDLQRLYSSNFHCLAPLVYQAVQRCEQPVYFRLNQEKGNTSTDRLDISDSGCIRIVF